MTQILAIASCRVSSPEQRQNGSLARQERSVIREAEILNAKIVRTWSEDASSKNGKNLQRKDIREMLEECKRNKGIKLLLVDEPDRFMRSIEEAMYLEMQFKLLGVRVWYTSDPTLNSDDMTAKLMKFMKYFVAEGSNEERQRKSVNGQADAIRQGRYTSHPKPGYKKGTSPGVHVLHPTRGPALRYVLRKLASGVITPTAALIELNESAFTEDHSLYKMDKFRKIATDGYYAGIIQIDKQVKATNLNGLHEPLITVGEHKRLVSIIEGKPKNQTGPNMKGNPSFPMSNLITDTACAECKHKGRLVGLNLSNGKTSKVYEKYRCRSCKRYIKKDDLHNKVIDLFERYEMTDDTRTKILNALDTVWQRDTDNINQEMRNVRNQMLKMETDIKHSVESATNPDYYEIKDDLLAAIRDKKKLYGDLEKKLDDLIASCETDKLEFMKFALSFVESTGQHFLEPYVSRENRVQCKQMLFPAGIHVAQNDKVYTPEISLFYRLATKKKDTEVSNNSLMVRVRGL